MAPKVDSDAVFVPRLKTTDEISAPRNEVKFDIIPQFLKPHVHGMVKKKEDHLMAEFIVYHFVLTVVPYFLFMLVPALRKWCFLWLVCFFFTLQTCVLFVHYTTHTNIWKPQYKWLNTYTKWVLTPMIGIPPGNVYDEHHTKMHHGQNNSYPGDLSSTESYERDNLFHWVLYWLRHMCLATFELPYWSLMYTSSKEAKDQTIGFIIFWGYHYTLYKVDPYRAVFMGYGTFMAMTFLFMLGNFSQHCLVNPKNARSSYGLSYNVINHKVNRGFWNDGYHLIHHLNSTIPWYRMPEAFLKQQEKIGKNGGLTFQGCKFQDVFIWGLLGQQDKIYEHFVPLCEEQDMTLEEFKEFIEPWYTPIFDKSVPETWYAWLLKKTSRREPIYIDYGKPSVYKAEIN